MPLPHFLLMLTAVLVAAGVTLWVAVDIGIPLPVVGMLALAVVAVLHLAAPADDSGDESSPRHGA